MKRLSMDEVKTMSVEDINSKIVELKKELLDLRFKQALGNLENTAEIKSVKVNVAILKTALNQNK